MSRATCSHGHEWNQANVYIGSNGKGACRACRREKDRKLRRERRTPERRKMERVSRFEIPAVLTLRCPECLAVYKRTPEERNTQAHDCYVERVSA